MTNELKIDRYKILLIGDQNVGKTSLTMCFARNTFNNVDSKTTVGVDINIKNVEIDGKKVELQIWDAAGQERYRALTAAYYRGAHGVMVVYAVTQHSSFGNVESWIRSVDQETDGVEMMIVGNKSDLSEQQRMVAEEAGRELASKSKLLFYETSAKLGANVEEAFLALAREIKTKLEKEGRVANPKMPDVVSFHQRKRKFSVARAICGDCGPVMFDD